DDEELACGEGGRRTALHLDAEAAVPAAEELVLEPGDPEHGVVHHGEDLRLPRAREPPDDLVFAHTAQPPGGPEPTHREFVLSYAADRGGGAAGPPVAG